MPSLNRIVLTKGIINVFLSLSIIFFPAAIYDGPLAAIVSKLTGLQFIYRDADPGSAFALASLIMGCGFAGISAGMSSQDAAYKSFATLNGVFAVTGLLGCMLSPKWFGSAILLLASLQDLFWSLFIVKVGGYSVVDTLGMQDVFDMLVKKKREVRNAVRDEGAPGSEK